MLDPFDYDALKNRPDTEVKLFNSLEGGGGSGDRISLMRELKGARKDGAQVLHLAEAIQGNVFSRPYPFITIRPIPPSEVLADDLKNDGDPMKDYFHTIRSVKKDRPGDEDPTVGFVFLGFKVIDNDRAPVLDRSWHEWTGLSEMLRALDRRYSVRRLQAWKAVNVKPDILKYCILLELAGTDGGLFARDYLQKFRIRRMSGYVAFYREWDSRKIDDVLRSTESLGAVIHNLAEED